MRSLKFLYIEDDKLFAEKLEKKIKEYFQKYDYNVEFEMYDHIPENIEVDHIDACFFDIEIKNQTTVEFINSTREKDMYMPMIIITNYEHYVFDTVHMQIFDYIRKSKIDIEMEQSLSKLKSYLHGRTDEIIVSTDKGDYRVHFKDILYVHIHSHYISIHKVNGKKIESWKNYDAVFSNESHIVRSHKSYAINMCYCEQLGEKHAYLKNCKKAIPISRRNYKKVSDKFVKNNSLIK